MFDPEYPCAKCGCSAWKHYTSMTGTGQPVCLICTMDILAGRGDPQRKSSEGVHEFVPDNLRWLEMKEAQVSSQKAMPSIPYKPGNVTYGQ